MTFFDHLVGAGEQRRRHLDFQGWHRSSVFATASMTGTCSCTPSTSSN